MRIVLWIQSLNGIDKMTRKYNAQNTIDIWKPLCVWPDDCFVQWGANGLVLRDGSLAKCFESEDPLSYIDSKVAYTTAFFEAFPKDPDTFIRGEGKTKEEAEASCYKKYQKIINCNAHEFERGNYRSGAGICGHCGLFMSKVFEPLEHCHVCQTPTYHGQDKYGKWYCEEHYKALPNSLLPEWLARHREYMKSLDGNNKEQ